MLIALLIFCFNVLSNIPHAVLLSILIDVTGCLCLSSLHVLLRGTRFCAFRNSALTSASAANDMTALMIFARITIGLLIIWLTLSLLARNLYPPTCDLALDATRYAASE